MEIVQRYYWELINSFFYLIRGKTKMLNKDLLQNLNNQNEILIKELKEKDKLILSLKQYVGEDNFLKILSIINTKTSKNLSLLKL